MRKNGFVTLEAIIVFPSVVLLIVSFIFVIIHLADKPPDDSQFNFMDRIYKVDSLYRKAGFIDDVLEQ